VLYSSLITPDNHKKGQSVGADAQISKPQLNKVVGLADELISKARGGSYASSQPFPVAAAPPPTPEAPRSKITPTSATPLRTVQPAPASSANATLGTATLTPPPATTSTDLEFDRIDRQLWRTFVQELQSHLVRLSDLSEQLSAGTADAPALQELGRILHCIKGAAMVVPIDTVARATHLLESLLDQVRPTPTIQSGAVFEHFADWLGDLCGPTSDPRAALARGPEVECDLAMALTRAAR
jgi:hypothetical protein